MPTYAVVPNRFVTVKAITVKAMSNKRYLPEADSGSNVSTALGISEHHVVRVMAGEGEVLRARLADALEQLGYRVLDENPLRAKHGARGAGEYYFSANALDYPTTLDIGLKQQGMGSTRVTFDYAVVHGHFGKGDRQSLTREAEAIIALAAHRAAQTNCIICGADFVADSRFCRKCGAPTTTAAPAELEVMRLTANGRAGHQWTSIGATILAVGTILPMFMWVIANFATFTKGDKVSIGIALISAIFGWWALLAGIRRTHLTLNPRNAKEEDISALPRRQTFSAPNTNDITLEPLRAAQLSITEGTTSLLHEVARPEREPVPIYRTEEKPAD